MDGVASLINSNSMVYQHAMTDLLLNRPYRYIYKMYLYAQTPMCYMDTIHI